MGLIRPQGSKGHVTAMNHQRQGDHSYYNGQCRPSHIYNNDLAQNWQHKKGKIYNGTTQTHLWYWLINHDIYRHENDGKPTAYLFDLYTQKTQINERKASLDHGRR